MTRLVDVCEISHEKMLVAQPRWTLNHLQVGPYRSGFEYNNFLAETVGFGDPILSSLDAIRFDPGDRCLAGLRIRLPEQSVPADVLSENLSRISAMPGTLRLEIQPHAVELAEPDSVFMHESRNHLIAWNGNKVDRISRMVGVAPGLSYFWGADIDGWLLREPARYLAVGWEQSAEPAPSHELTAIVTDYVATISDEFVEALEDFDQTAQQEVRRLLRRTSEIPWSPQRHALECKLRSIVEIFDVPDSSGM